MVSFLTLFSSEASPTCDASKSTFTVDRKRADYPYALYSANMSPLHLHSLVSKRATLLYVY